MQLEARLNSIGDNVSLGGSIAVPIAAARHPADFSLGARAVRVRGERVNFTREPTRWAVPMCLFDNPPRGRPHRLGARPR